MVGVGEGISGEGGCLHVFKYSTSGAMTGPFSHTPAFCQSRCARIPILTAFSACERVVYTGGS